MGVASSAERSAPPSGMRFEDLWLPKDGLMHDDYEDGQAYGQSKLANVMYAKELATRLNGTDVSTYSLHPGVILTELGRDMGPELMENMKSQNIITSFITGTFFKLFYFSNFSAEDGALTQLHLATANKEKLVNGGFYHPIGSLTEPTHPQASNQTLAHLLWEETQLAIKKGANYKFSG